MKKILGTILSTLLVVSAAQASSIRDNCGCGLGTMALGDQEATVLSQLGATFLNNISGNQTFGISSGTLECDPASSFASNKKVIEYVSDNMDHLAFDMAKGEGDSLDALADLMGVEVDAREDVFVKMQSQFERIFPTEAVTANEVVRNITAIMQS